MLLGCTFIDILTTYVIVEKLGGQEVNPIMHWLLSIGWPFAIIVKIIVGIGGPYIAKVLFPNAVNLLHMILVASILQLIVSCSNVIQMAIFIQ